MRLVLKILGAFLLLYFLIWAGLALYFSYVDREKPLFERHLTRLFERPVSIGSIETTWHGLSPYVVVTKLRVDSDFPEQAAFEFDTLKAKLSPWSVLTFWPQFTQFSVQNPVVEVVSLDQSTLMVGGFTFDLRSSGNKSPKKLIQWLLDQKGGAWIDGEIIFRGQNNDVQHYKGVTFTYARQKQDRFLNAEFIGTYGEVAFDAKSTGDLLSEKDWNASIDILGDDGKALQVSEGLGLRVVNGKGVLKLRQLDVQSIRNFIQLIGLSEQASWLYGANLKGRLHDMSLHFSGPLLSIEDWHLEASASEVAFNATDIAPAMNALSGQLRASQKGGEFLFSTLESTFEWQRWFETPFSIKQAAGRFSWDVTADGGVLIALNDGIFEDQNCRISNLTGTVKIQNQTQKVTSLGDLFKVDSVADLDYQGGTIVDSREDLSVPPDVHFFANFELNKAANFDHYLPKSEKLSGLRKWWGNAFLSGSLNNGVARFDGPLSLESVNLGQATLSLQADFNDVGIDYGHPLDWPKVSKANGVLSVNKDVLTIVADDDSYIGVDKVRGFQLTIPALFEPNLTLFSQGQMTLSLETLIEFIFRGPLIAPANRPKELPLIAKEGSAELNVSLEVPLNKVTATKVKGQAIIHDGFVFLPGDLPIENMAGEINFTENSVVSDLVTADFLGGKTTASIETLSKALPPKLKLKAQGSSPVEVLEPWLGEHMLTLLSGNASWSSDVIIDNGHVTLDVQSDLLGVEVAAPKPLLKGVNEPRPLHFYMDLGNQSQGQEVRLDYANALQAHMQAKGVSGSLFDQAIIRLSDGGSVGNDSVGNDKADKINAVADGVAFDIVDDAINLDDWLSAIIDLAEYEPRKPSDNTDFLDAMRSIKLDVSSPILLNRQFGEMSLALFSDDGVLWNGDIEGEHIQGAMTLAPRDNRYLFDLTRLNLIDEIDGADDQLNDVDYGLSSDSYPELNLLVNDFHLSDKKLGNLNFLGKPSDDGWLVDTFELKGNGVSTSLKGLWVNNQATGSLTSLDFQTDISQADAALGDFSLDGFINKGNGSISGNVNWVGAPHEFDYARLNGDFDLVVSDGELVKVEPGGGKLLGLLNFNAVARRLTLDFSDVLASGLAFDRMQYRGLFADGKAVMQEAYILAPAVFVRMEGQIDLVDETIDMEIHMSPELGGNIALLSALANPAAGAVVFLTQRLFQEELRDSNFLSYRALGTWEGFELEQFDINTNDAISAPIIEKETDACLNDQCESAELTQ